MIGLISLLVEKSLGDDNKLQISEKDYNSFIGGKVSFLKLRVNNRSDITVSREVSGMGAQWLNGRVLDSRPRGRGFEPHRRHCVVVLEQDTFILA